MDRYGLQPLIGISGGLVRTNEWSPPVVGHRQSYVEAVLQAGGLPVVLPPLTDPRALRALYERLDGVLLAGGDDIDPVRYGDWQVAEPRWRRLFAALVTAAGHTATPALLAA